DHGQVAAAVEPVLFPAAAKSTVLACGPGLGQGPGVTRVVIDLLARANKPCVLDADGLNAVARTPESLRRRDPLVITPHPGAFAAAQLGTYLHGLAGDLARDSVGEICLTATDVLAFLPRAFHTVAPR